MTGCRETRETLLDTLVAGAEMPGLGPVADHVAQCDRCRTEWEECRQTWLMLGDAAETVPGEHVRPQVLRRVRQALRWECVLTVGGWLPAALAAALGVGLSLVLAVVVPYAWLVSACRESLQLGEGQAAPYVLAGVVYALPLAAGPWFLRRRVVAGGIIGSLEATLLFLVILAPFVVISCRELAPVLLGAFVSGLAGGAVAASLGGFGLMRALPRSGALS